MVARAPLRVTCLYTKCLCMLIPIACNPAGVLPHGHFFNHYAGSMNAGPWDKVRNCLPKYITLCMYICISTSSLTIFPLRPLFVVLLFQGFDHLFTLYPRVPHPLGCPKYFMANLSPHIGILPIELFPLCLRFSPLLSLFYTTDIFLK
jgi:hypothetical protein